MVMWLERTTAHACVWEFHVNVTLSDASVEQWGVSCWWLPILRSYPRTPTSAAWTTQPIESTQMTKRFISFQMMYERMPRFMVEQ